MRWHKIGGASLRHLSMGMSGDFELAIAEGATMVRIGTALFGGKGHDHDENTEWECVIRFMDLFDFFRYALGTVVTIYATLVTAQSLLGWYRWLNQPERYTTVLGGCF